MYRKDNQKNPLYHLLMQLYYAPPCKSSEIYFIMSDLKGGILLKLINIQTKVISVIVCI